MVVDGRPGHACHVACDGGDTYAAAGDRGAETSARDLAAVLAREAGRLAHAHVVTVVRNDADAGAEVVTRWSPTGARGPSTDDALELAAGVAGHREPRRIILRLSVIDGMPSASGLVLPILVGEDVWGALVVTLQPADPLRPSTERQLAVLAELAAPALGGEAHGASRVSIARRATEAISAALGGMLVRMIALDGALPPAARVLAVAPGASAVRPPVALDVALVSAIGVGDRSVRVADVARDVRFERVMGSDRWSGAASAPIAVGHDVRGAITAYGDTRGVPTVAGTRFLLAAANVVAAALDRPHWEATVNGSRA
jgi:hypothetical protein